MSAFRILNSTLFIIIWTSIISTSVSAGVLDIYSGTWRGTGEIVLKDGRRESVNCKVQSTVEVNGTRAYHKVKCKSDSKKINVRINLVANERYVTGNWSASGAVEGDIKGSVHGKSLRVQLSGHRISASLNLSASHCRQSMVLNGKIGKIRKISVQLKKNC